MRMRTSLRNAALFVVMAPVLAGASVVQAQTIKTYFNDLQGFNAAAGSPPVVVDFENISAGTGIGNTTISGITFAPGNLPAPSAPLIVVRGADTFTPSGFVNVIDASTNRLFATSGQNVLSPGGVTLGPGPNPSIENDDISLTLNPPAASIGFDVLYQELDCCSITTITVLDAGGNTLYSASVPTGYSGPGSGGGAPGGSSFAGFVSTSSNIARIIINEGDGDNFFPDANIGLDTIRMSRGSTFVSFLDKLEEFNRVAGAPPLRIVFFDFAPGTDITGSTLGDVRFDARTTGGVSAPLIVVPGADTYTPAGFNTTIDITKNKLLATNGANVLSPGGAVLGPGRDPLIENDDLELTFNPPVSAVGFDLLFQEKDLFSLTAITIYDPAGTVLYFIPEVSSGFAGPGTGGGGPGGSTFIGFASSSPNIAKLVVDEYDDDNGFPDCNVGYDSFRYARNPVAASIDVMPSQFPNMLNLGSPAVPVVVYGSPALDAAAVNPATMTLAVPGVTIAWRTDPGRCQLVDSNADGLQDLLCALQGGDVIMMPSSGKGVLEARTYSGDLIRGEDSIVIPPRRSLTFVQPSIEPVAAE